MIGKTHFRGLLVPTLFVAFACAFQTAQAQEKTQFFFAEDVSVSKDRKLNMVPRQAMPRTKAAAEEFQRIGGASSASFEELHDDEAGFRVH